MTRSITYKYKPVATGIYTDITNQIEVHASGSESINSLPGQFKLGISTYARNGTGTTVLSTIDVNIGDEILILESGINIIAYGAVFNPGREMIKWDRKNSKAICRFNPECVQPDFSSYPISSLSFTQTLLSVILNELFLYSDESIGLSDIGKYLLTFDDFIIDSFSVENKTLREALTDLLEQIDCFWCVKYQLITDETVGYIVKRYCEISSKNGNTPSLDSTWSGGISNDNVRYGYIPNPIVANRTLYPIIAAETDFQIVSDPSVIINSLELSAKVFDKDDNASLSRYDHPAELNKFDYELDGYAGDILSVAFLVKTTVLSASTSTHVKISSRKAVNIEAGDTAYFEDSHPNDFFLVNSVNKINNVTTEIIFSPALSFTPTAGEKFEIVGNVPIFRTEKELNYASKGVLIDFNKKNYAKIRFLDLSEPPPGITITVFYTKLKDYTNKSKNDASIKTPGIGLKYRNIKLDDDLIFTRKELDNLSSKILQLVPEYKFSTLSRREYNLVPIGMSIPIKIDNLITENFILTEFDWELVGNDDKNKKPAIVQNLTFSTLVSDPEKVIERIKRQKKQISSSAVIDEKQKQFEKITISERISWGFNRVFNRDFPAPIITGATSITDKSFILNWESVSGAEKYYVTVWDIATGAIIPGFNDVNAGNGTSQLVSSDPYITPNTGYNCKVRAYSEATGASPYSANYSVNTVASSFPSGLIAFYDFNTDTNDQSGNGYNASLIGASNITNQYLNIPNNLNNYLSADYRIIDGLGDFTICAWVKINTFTGSNAFLSSQIDGTGTLKFEIRYDTVGVLDWVVIIDSNYANYVNNTIDDHGWHHLAITRAGSSVSMFLDGSLVSMQTINSNALIGINGGTFFGIRSEASDQAWAGDIDNIFIYNRELNSTERAILKDYPRNT